ncbi:pyruvate kinase [Thalassotalea eurytherma]|uniref:Pyruvate kinase n=1 Tax=Thalassotalea eurytherma TaxID=1144278 RepID=A0ABQ6H410_9GAMM|nr:pyruvate kinase [Thalassotalea eurytherma]GLX81875.1 pyruvate kinase [Thalassotalea eurytherma]
MLRRTKIVATLGPATDDKETLKKVLAAGVNVVRLNFSHGAPEDHINRANMVREISKELGVYVGILGDLQGPKIRVSTFKDNKKIQLAIGDKFELDATLPKGEGCQEKVGIDYKQLPQDVSTGDILLLDDGRVQLKVLSTTDTSVMTEVTVGGPLSNNKGINRQGGGLSAAALTDKDKADIKLAAKIKTDFLAVSFPRDAADMREARLLAQEAGCDTRLVAKVERAEAVASDETLDGIILASDVVMVARGDLGVEIGDAELVGKQKHMIARARQLNRAVITATQMMESMISSPMPTRAEVMDVANAVLDGTDAVMLSAETAAGDFPVETVEAMANVCLGAEKQRSVNISKHRVDLTFTEVSETIALSAMYAANHLDGVKAIIALTESGQTSKVMSRITSGLPIYSLSRHNKTLTKTAIYRGVYPVEFDSRSCSNDSLSNEVLKLLTASNDLNVGDKVIFTHGDMMETVGATNTLKVLKVTKAHV